MDKDIPDSLIYFIFIALAALIAIWIGYSLAVALNAEDPVEGQLEQENSEFIIVQGLAIKGSSPVVHVKPKVLAIMDYDVEYEVALLLNKIAECESGWRDNVCNGQYGCRGGQGVFQLIPSTVRYCEGKLGKSIDPFNQNDNIECAIWLITETPQGYYHWGYPDGYPNAYHKGIRWGSYNCFKDAIPK